MIMGIFFVAVSLYCLVYIFQLGITVPRVSGVILFALLGIGCFRR
jgi:hypothetical protein